MPKRYGRVEQELVHPLIRGSDVQRWRANPSVDILLVQDTRERRGVDEDTMARCYPGALEYLQGFEEELRRRAAFRRYFTRRHHGRIVETGPYWSMFNVGHYSLSPFKVVWKDIATDFAAAVVEPCDPVLLSAHTVMEVACESVDEAHFVCGALNSTPARTFVAAYVATHISTHTVAMIHVPRFDPADPSHRAIAAASRTAHTAVSKGREPDQRSVDIATAQLWDLSDDQIDAMRTYLDQLQKRDVAQEEAGIGALGEE
jgi:hypothetical protein